jgi:hypothetical protein
MTLIQPMMNIYTCTSTVDSKGSTKNLARDFIDPSANRE